MPYPGQPKNEPIPPALNRWNWGAFFLNWVWGLGNSTYIALLMFVPVVNIVMIFVLGAKGSQWAWKNRLWEDEAHFVRTQRNWARASLAVLVAMVLFVGFISSTFRNSDAVELTMQEIRSNAALISVMGEPVELGWFVTGTISSSGTKGHADLAIPISGRKCSGKAYSRSRKSDGIWEIYLLLVQLDCKSEVIVLINQENVQIPNAERASSSADI